MCSEIKYLDKCCVLLFVGCLYHLTSAILANSDFKTMEGGNKDILKAITKPLTKLIVQVRISLFYPPLFYPPLFNPHYFIPISMYMYKVAQKKIK